MKFSHFQTTLLLVTVLLFGGGYGFTKYQGAKWRAHDATVILENCAKDQSCEFKGTLRINIWTDMYHLLQADGNELVFSRDAFAMISFPLPEDSPLRQATDIKE